MIIKENVAYNCKTKKLALEFLKLVEKEGIKWRSGDNPTTFDNFNKYGSDTCYEVHDGILSFCEKSFFEIQLEEPVIEFKGASKTEEEKFKVVFNDPATILFVDGEKYVCKAYKEKFDEEKALAITLCKYFGVSYSQLKKMIRGAKREGKSLKVKEEKKKPSKSKKS